jgi:hypothetical protein
MRKRKIPKRTPEEIARSEAIGEQLRRRLEELRALDAARAAVPDPEDLSEDERAEILRAVRERSARELENRVIVAELRRRALEAERQAS